MFVVPLPEQSKTKKYQKGLGLISSMLHEESLKRIVRGDFSNFNNFGNNNKFEDVCEEFKKLEFTTFDMTHFAVQILVDESLRKF